MSRIPTPANPESAPAQSTPMLEAVQKQLGSVPNMFRIIANSPAALEGFLGLNGALGNGVLDPATRERIALAVAEINGCDYCLAAHSYLGANIAKLSDNEMQSNRRGTSTDAKAAAAIEFVVEVVNARGAVSEASLQLVRDAGYSDAEIVEIVVHVALNTLTNYVNKVLDTDVDFPVVQALAA